MASNEKATAATPDYVEAPHSKKSDSLTPSTHDDLNLSPIDKNKTIRKIDLHVLPMLVLVYLFAFLDRVNIGNAATFGMLQELNLTGNKFNVALCIFFVPYILFEIPANILMKRFNPHKFLSVSIFLFGITSIGQGFVKTYGQLVATRTLLGLFETGIFPGSFYILAMWYPRRSSQKRFSFFFLSTALAGAFGGLLAYGIGHIHANGYAPWRWIFIIEGIATCAVAVAAWFLIADFPEDVRWLSAEEKHWLKKRLESDVGENLHAEKIRLRDLSMIVTDYKFLLSGILYFVFLIPMYAFALFSPVIIQGWGINSTETQARTIPIWVCSWLTAMAVAFYSDKLQKRFYFIVFPSLVSVVGFIILLALPNSHIPTANVGVKYFALFLLQCGVFSATPVVVCWFTTNLRTHKQRSIGSAWQISFGNCGGIVATFVFLKKDAPAYTLGYSVCIGALGVGIVTALGIWWGMSIENKRADREEAEGVETRVGEMRGYRYIR